MLTLKGAGKFIYTGTGDAEAKSDNISGFTGMLNGNGTANQNLKLTNLTELNFIVGDNWGKVIVNGNLNLGDKTLGNNDIEINQDKTLTASTILNNKMNGSGTYSYTGNDDATISIADNFKDFKGTIKSTNNKNLTLNGTGTLGFTIGDDWAKVIIASGAEVTDDNATSKLGDDDIEIVGKLSAKTILDNKISGSGVYEYIGTDAANVTLASQLNGFTGSLTSTTATDLKLTGDADGETLIFNVGEKWNKVEIAEKVLVEGDKLGNKAISIKEGAELTLTNVASAGEITLENDKSTLNADSILTVKSTDGKTGTYNYTGTTDVEIALGSDLKDFKGTFNSTQNKNLTLTGKGTLGFKVSEGWNEVYVQGEVSATNFANNKVILKDDAKLTLSGSSSLTQGLSGIGTVAIDTGADLTLGGEVAMKDIKFDNDGTLIIATTGLTLDLTDYNVGTETQVPLITGTISGESSNVTLKGVASYWNVDTTDGLKLVRDSKILTWTGDDDTWNSGDVNDWRTGTEDIVFKNGDSVAFDKDATVKVEAAVETNNFGIEAGKVVTLTGAKVTVGGIATIKGTLDAQNEMAFKGLTIEENGKVTINNDATSFDGAISNSGSLIFNADNSLAKDISGNGSVIISTGKTLTFTGNAVENTIMLDGTLKAKTALTKVIGNGTYEYTESTPFTVDLKNQLQGFTGSLTSTTATDLKLVGDADGKELTFTVGQNWNNIEIEQKVNVAGDKLGGKTITIKDKAELALTNAASSSVGEITLEGDNSILNADSILTVKSTDGKTGTYNYTGTSDVEITLGSDLKDFKGTFNSTQNKNLTLKGNGDLGFTISDSWNEVYVQGEVSATNFANNKVILKDDAKLTLSGSSSLTQGLSGNGTVAIGAGADLTLGGEVAMKDIKFDNDGTLNIATTGLTLDLTDYNVGTNTEVSLIAGKITGKSSDITLKGVASYWNVDTTDGLKLVRDAKILTWTGDDDTWNSGDVNDWRTGTEDIVFKNGDSVAFDKDVTVEVEAAVETNNFGVEAGKVVTLTGEKVTVGGIATIKGTLDAQNEMAFKGLTIEENGKVTINKTTSFDGAVSNSGSLIFNADNTLAKDISGNGSVTINTGKTLTFTGNAVENTIVLDGTLKAQTALAKVIGNGTYEYTESTPFTVNLKNQLQGFTGELKSTNEAALTLVGDADGETLAFNLGDKWNEVEIVQKVTVEGDKLGNKAISIKDGAELTLTNVTSVGFITFEGESSTLNTDVILSAAGNGTYKYTGATDANVSLQFSSSLVKLFYGTLDGNSSASLKLTGANDTIGSTIGFKVGSNWKDVVIAGGQVNTDANTFGALDVSVAGGATLNATGDVTSGIINLDATNSTLKSTTKLTKVTGQGVYNYAASSETSVTLATELKGFYGTFNNTGTEQALILNGDADGEDLTFKVGEKWNLVKIAGTVRATNSVIQDKDVEVGALATLDASGIHFTSVEVKESGALNLSGSAVANKVTNAGKIQIKGASTINGIEGAGSVTVKGGELTLDGAIAHRIDVAAGQTLKISDGATISLDLNAGGNNKIINNGTINFMGDVTLTLSDFTATDVSVKEHVLIGGKIVGDFAKISIDGGLDPHWSLDITDAGLVLQFSNLELTWNDQDNATEDQWNSTEKDWEANGSQTSFFEGDSVVLNENVMVAADVIVDNMQITDNVELSGEMVTVNGDATIEADKTLTVENTIDFNGAVNNGGTIDFATDQILDVDIAGGKVVVSNGTLDVDVANGFEGGLEIKTGAAVNMNVADTISGEVSGDGALNINENTTLNNADAYAGEVTIDHNKALTANAIIDNVTGGTDTIYNYSKDGTASVTLGTDLNQFEGKLNNTSGVAGTELTLVGDDAGKDLNFQVGDNWDEVTISKKVVATQTKLGTEAIIDITTDGDQLIIDSIVTNNVTGEGTYQYSGAADATVSADSNKNFGAFKGTLNSKEEVNLTLVDNGTLGLKVGDGWKDVNVEGALEVTTLGDNNVVIKEGASLTDTNGGELTTDTTNKVTLDGIFNSDSIISNKSVTGEGLYNYTNTADAEVALESKLKGFKGELNAPNGANLALTGNTDTASQLAFDLGEDWNTVTIKEKVEIQNDSGILGDNNVVIEGELTDVGALTANDANTIEIKGTLNTDNILNNAVSGNGTYNYTSSNKAEVAVDSQLTGFTGKLDATVTDGVDLELNQDGTIGFNVGDGWKTVHVNGDIEATTLGDNNVVIKEDASLTDTDGGELTSKTTNKVTLDGTFNSDSIISNESVTGEGLYNYTNTTAAEVNLGTHLTGFQGTLDSDKVDEVDLKLGGTGKLSFTVSDDWKTVEIVDGGNVDLGSKTLGDNEVKIAANGTLTAETQVNSNENKDVVIDGTLNIGSILNNPVSGAATGVYNYTNKMTSEAAVDLAKQLKQYKGKLNNASGVEQALELANTGSSDATIGFDIGENWSKVVFTEGVTKVQDTDLDGADENDNLAVEIEENAVVKFEAGTYGNDLTMKGGQAVMNGAVVFDNNGSITLKKGVAEQIDLSQNSLDVTQSSLTNFEVASFTGLGNNGNDDNGDGTLDDRDEALLKFSNATVIDTQTAEKRNEGRWFKDLKDALQTQGVNLIWKDRESAINNINTSDSDYAPDGVMDYERFVKDGLDQLSVNGAKNGEEVTITVDVADFVISDTTTYGGDGDNCDAVVGYNGMEDKIFDRMLINDDASATLTDTEQFGGTGIHVAEAGKLILGENVANLANTTHSQQIGVTSEVVDYGTAQVEVQAAEFNAKANLDDFYGRVYGDTTNTFVADGTTLGKMTIADFAKVRVDKYSTLNATLENVADLEITGTMTFLFTGADFNHVGTISGDGIIISQGTTFRGYTGSTFSGNVMGDINLISTDTFANAKFDTNSVNVFGTETTIGKLNTTALNLDMTALEDRQAGSLTVVDKDFKATSIKAALNPAANKSLVGTYTLMNLHEEVDTTAMEIALENVKHFTDGDTLTVDGAAFCSAEARYQLINENGSIKLRADDYVDDNGFIRDVYNPASAQGGEIRSMMNNASVFSRTLNGHLSSILVENDRKAVAIVDSSLFDADNMTASTTTKTKAKSKKVGTIKQVEERGTTSVWGEALYSYSEYEGFANNGDSVENTFGGMIGFEQNYRDLNYGIFLGALSSDIGSGKSVDVESESIYVGVYGGFTDGKWFINGGVMGGYSMNDTSRVGLYNEITGDYDSIMGSVFLEAGLYHNFTDTIYGRISAGAQYTYADAESYEESIGGNYVESNDFDSLSVAIDGRLGYKFTNGFVEARAGLAFELMKEEIVSHFSLLDNPAAMFSAIGGKLDSTKLILGLDAGYNVNENIELRGGILGEVGDENKRFTGNIRLIYSF